MLGLLEVSLMCSALSALYSYIEIFYIQIYSFYTITTNIVVLNVYIYIVAAVQQLTIHEYQHLQLQCKLVAIYLFICKCQGVRFSVPNRLFIF